MIDYTCNFVFLNQEIVEMSQTEFSFFESNSIEQIHKTVEDKMFSILENEKENIMPSN